MWLYVALPFSLEKSVYIFLVLLQTDNADSRSDVSYLLSSPAVKTASCLFYTSWCFFFLFPLTSLGQRPVYLFPSISSAMDQNCQDNLMVHWPANLAPWRLSNSSPSTPSNSRRRVWICCSVSLWHCGALAYCCWQSVCVCVCPSAGYARLRSAAPGQHYWLKPESSKTNSACKRVVV